jgi:hypothetical protein
MGRLGEDPMRAVTKETPDLLASLERLAKRIGQAVR